MKLLGIFLLALNPSAAFNPLSPPVHSLIGEHALGIPSSTTSMTSSRCQIHVLVMRSKVGPQKARSWAQQKGRPRTHQKARSVTQHRTRAVPEPFARTPTTEEFEASVKKLTLDSGGVLLIDGDNVRGKARFRLPHLTLLTRLARWAQRLHISGHVVLLHDHGSVPTAYHLPRLGGVSVGFSGPELTADIVAVRDIEQLQARGHDVILVTSDFVLAERCLRTSARAASSVEVVPSHVLLESLDFFSVPGSGMLSAEYLAASRTSSRFNATAPVSEEQLQALEDEVRARTALTSTQKDLEKHPGFKKQRLATLKSQQDELNTAISKVAELSAPLLADVVSPNADSDHAGAGCSLSTDMQEAIMCELIQKRTRRPAMEQLAEHQFDRVVLAEVLRRRLERRSAQDLGGSACPAAAYAALHCVFPDSTAEKEAVAPKLYLDMSVRE